MDAFFGSRQAVARAPLHGRQPEAAPFGDHAVERGLARNTGNAKDGQIDRCIGFKAGVGEQQAHQIVLPLTRGSRLNDQTDGVFLA